MSAKNLRIPAISGHQIRLLLLRLKTSPTVASQLRRQFAADLQRLTKAQENAAQENAVLPTASLEAKAELFIAFRTLERNLNWFEQRESENGNYKRFISSCQR